MGHAKTAHFRACRPGTCSWHAFPMGNYGTQLETEKPECMMQIQTPSKDRKHVSCQKLRIFVPAGLHLLLHRISHWKLRHRTNARNQSALFLIQSKDRKKCVRPKLHIFVPAGPQLAPGIAFPIGNYGTQLKTQKTRMHNANPNAVQRSKKMGHAKNCAFSCLQARNLFLA